LNHNDEQVYTEEKEMGHATYAEGMAKDQGGELGRPGMVAPCEEPDLAHWAPAAVKSLKGEEGQVLR